MPAPPYNLSDSSGTPLKLEAIRVSCLHYPSEEGRQVPLMASFLPSALECTQVSSSVKQGQEPLFHKEVVRTNADG